jgi:hypothetical protein
MNTPKLPLLLLLASTAHAQPTSPEAPADACAAARARHADALVGDLKHRSVKLGLNMMQGRLVKRLRASFDPAGAAKTGPSLLSVAQLTTIAIPICRRTPDAAAPLARAWLRLAEGAVLCGPVPTHTLTALWPFANAMQAAGCPLAAETRAVPVLTTLSEHEDLKPTLAPLITLLTPRP